MELNEFEKVMNEAPDRADLDKITLPEGMQEQEPADSGSPASGEEDGDGSVTMSIGQFAVTAVSIYTKVSDMVYKRVKKAETAPKWTSEEMDSLASAATPVLEQYNIRVSPITNLLVTIAVIEAMRYAKPVENQQNTQNDGSTQE